MNWQPIETAPNDGRLILVWWTYFQMPRLAHFSTASDEWLFGGFVPRPSVIPCRDIANAKDGDGKRLYSAWAEIVKPAGVLSAASLCDAPAGQRPSKLEGLA